MGRRIEGQQGQCGEYPAGPFQQSLSPLAQLAAKLTAVCYDVSVQCMRQKFLEGKKYASYIGQKMGDGDDRV